MKLNIGCGCNWEYNNWIGIDHDKGSTPPPAYSNIMPFNMKFDLTKGFPFENNSIDVIYLSHIFEHFTYNEIIYIMSEIYRILKVDGVLAMVVPDLDLYLEEYRKKDSSFFNISDNRDLVSNTDKFLINYYPNSSFNDACPNYFYNYENLCALLDIFSFKEVIKVDFRKFTYCQEINENIFERNVPYSGKLMLCVECKKDRHDDSYKKAPQYESTIITIHKKEHVQAKVESAWQDTSNLCTELESVLRDKNNLHAEFQAVMQEKLNIQGELFQLRKQLNKIYSSRGWRMLVIAYRIKEKIIPAGTLRRRIAKKIFNTLKIIKNKLKKETNNSKENSPKAFIRNSILFDSVEKRSFIDASIAVHLHLYYVDLLDEFISYLNNIPYKFDIFISTQEEENQEVIKCAIQKIRNVNKVTVHGVPNIGRDFAPMFSEFGNELVNYDYLLHIHTKKSLWTTMEQREWRIYMLSALLGSQERIQEIFGLFECNALMGTIYPETPTFFPYWGHTYLKSRKLIEIMFNKLGIPVEDRYMDFSVGSMFWIKTKAIRQLFELKLQYSDFGIEAGQKDGTLAHALERIFVPLVKRNGFEYATIDLNNQRFNLNYGHKNLHQYYALTKSDVIEHLRKFDIVTFDIFDTLITRKIYEPEDLFKIMNLKIKKEMDLVIDFASLRKQAEIKAASEKANWFDTTLHDIYTAFHNLSGITLEQAEKIKNMEFELELKYCVPRQDMLDIFNILLKEGKKIILLSDMYLPSDFVDKILKNCGYSGYSMWISCDVSCRKDDDSMWIKFFKEFNDVSTIHVGDNECSDIQRLADMWKPQLHVMQGRKMFLLTDFSDSIETFRLSRKVGDSILLGLMINRLYNSPFVFNRTKGRFEVQTLYDFGYMILGPALLYFYIWLMQELAKDKPETILFLARDGYYLQRLYEDYLTLFGNNNLLNIDQCYFMSSRRASSVAAIQTYEDITRILEPQFEGKLSWLMKSRFGLELPTEVNDRDIFLPQDFDTVIETIRPYQDEIIAQAFIERECYLEYIKKKIGDISNKNLSIVDLGYSGTIQYNLSKILNKKIAGYYIALGIAKPHELGCKATAAFGEYIPGQPNSALCDYGRVLESFLTAPHGQLQKFIRKEGKIIPIFDDSTIISKTLSERENIYQGIRGLFNDVANLSEGNLSIEHFNRELIEVIYSTAVFSGSLQPEVYDALTLETSYNNHGTCKNAIEILKAEYRK